MNLRDARRLTSVLNEHVQVKLDVLATDLNGLFPGLTWTVISLPTIEERLVVRPADAEPAVHRQDLGRPTYTECGRRAFTRDGKPLLELQTVRQPSTCRSCT